MKTTSFCKSFSAILFVMTLATTIPVSVFGQQPPAGEDVVLLDQGWSHEDRLKYYYTSQGTAVLPYDLFLNLEEANSSDLFRSDRISRSLGMIPQVNHLSCRILGNRLGFNGLVSLRIHERGTSVNHWGSLSNWILLPRHPRKGSSIRLWTSSGRLKSRIS